MSSSNHRPSNDPRRFSDLNSAQCRGSLIVNQHWNGALMARSKRSQVNIPRAIGRQVYPKTETAPSILCFAAIQGVKRKQDLAGLAPKRCFISAEAIERVVGQIGETQKATRELSGRIDIRFDRFRHGAGHGCYSVRNAVRCRIVFETARVRPPEQRIDNFSRDRVNLAGLSTHSDG